MLDGPDTFPGIEQNFEQNKRFLCALPGGRISYFTSRIYPGLALVQREAIRKLSKSCQKTKNFVGWPFLDALGCKQQSLQVASYNIAYLDTVIAENMSAETLMWRSGRLITDTTLVARDFD